jgi:hypothetical protein
MCRNTHLSVSIIVGRRLKPKTAQLWVTAIKALASVLRDDESTDAEYMVTHVDELARRWGNLHPENRGDTIRAYTSRCRSGLAKFLAWRTDPSSVKFASREARGRVPKATAKTDSSADANPKASAPSQPPAPEFRTFPLSEGRQVVFAIPDDFNSKDVRRYACHLLTLANDFDPTEPHQAQFFAIARRNE